MATVTVLGSGMMGTAFCVPLLDNGHDVRLVGTHLDQAIIESLRARDYHPKLDFVVPSGMAYFQVDELEQALLGADLVGLGVSSAGIRWAAETLTPHLPSDVPVVSIAKGLEWGEGGFRILPDVFRDGLGRSDVCEPVAVGGPCIAGELLRRAETCVVMSGRDSALASAIADLLRTDYYHVWTSPDPVGVEVCAALKNAYAMAIGFAPGLHEKRGGQGGSIALHNYEAAVYTQSLVEMKRLIGLAGGEPTTADGLAGAGDLLVTCNGGRTGRFGRWLGLGLSVDEAVEKMDGATLECLDIIRIVSDALPTLIKRTDLGEADLPLMHHMIDVLFGAATVDIPFAQFFAT